MRQWISSVVEKIKKLAKGRPVSRRQKTPRSRSFVPGLEVLESRFVPSTLTVTNLSDTRVVGDGSLRGEIAAAQPGDTINFQPGLSGTINLTSGELLINKNLTIEGPGATSLAINGQNASRVFDISSGATVTIEGLTVANGSETDCSDQLGSPLTSFGGGGILNEAGCTLTLNQDTLSGNTATAIADTVDVFGGGLLNEGSATVNSCTFSDNKVMGGGGSSFFGGSVGGGIDNFGGATLAVTGSTFTGNQALGAGSGNFGIGGAIENNAGLLAESNGLVTGPSTPSLATITNCTFTGNEASGSTGVLGNGGALDNEGTGATMTVTGSTFLDNESASGGNSGSVGGAIMNFANSTLTVTNSSFSNNQVLGSGSGNSGGGGAIANDGGDGSTSTVLATITNCTFTGNTASGNAIFTGYLDIGNGYGGALFNYGSHGIMTVSDSTVAANSASVSDSDTFTGNYDLSPQPGDKADNDGVAGGGNYTLSVVGSGDGGGIANEAGGSATLTNTIVANSTLGGDLYGGAFTGSYDLIGDGSNLSSFTNSLAGNPLLAPLGENGGPTQTMALLPGSPAIGAGVAIAGITTDQRGFSRPASDPDIGAFQTPVVSEAPQIIQSPTSVVYKTSAVVTFLAAAKGDPAPTVQWMYSANGGQSFTPFTGGTSPTLTFTATKTFQNTLFKAVFTNTQGIATTSMAFLGKAPSILTHFVSPASQTVQVGHAATFKTGSSLAGVKVQWQVSTDSGQTWSNDTTDQGATSTTLSVASTASANGNQYRALLTSGADIVSTTAATLTVTGIPLVITVQPPTTVTGTPGNPVTISAAATGCSPTAPAVWEVSSNRGVTFKKVTSIDIPGAVQKTTLCDGVFTTTLTFTGASADKNFVFKAVFSSPAGKKLATSRATLTD